MDVLFLSYQVLLHLKKLIFFRLFTLQTKSCQWSIIAHISAWDGKVTGANDNVGFINVDTQFTTSKKTFAIYFMQIYIMKNGFCNKSYMCYTYDLRNWLKCIICYCVYTRLISVDLQKSVLLRNMFHFCVWNLPESMLMLLITPAQINILTQNNKLK